MKKQLQKKLFTLIIFSIVATFSWAQPEPCGTPAAMTQTCFDACVICDIDGFTGRNDIPTGGQAFPEFCTFDYDRMAYIAFIAGTENLEIQVTVTNCVGWSGLEVGIFESFDCENFTPVTICDTDILANTTQTFSNTVPLVIGQHYYLVMDGSSGTICDWTFEVLEGSTAVNPLLSSGNISGNTSTCTDFPTTFATTGPIGAALFYWTVNGTPQTPTSQAIDITFPDDGFYEVCVTAANVCNDAPPTCTIVTVETPETLNLVEEICDNDCYEVAGETICETGFYDFVITLPNGVIV